MAAIAVYDRVKETSTTTGTGTLTLSGAQSGYRAFSSVMSTNDVTYYCIQNQTVPSEWEVGIGTLTGATTLARTTITASSNSGSATSFSAGTKDVFISYSAYPAAGTLSNSVLATGRLTLVSGTAVPTSDQNSKATIYYTPYKGNHISFYNSTLDAWIPINYVETSVAVPSTLFKVFDIFGYSNSGVLGLETLDWSQTTGTVTGATNASPVVITSNAHGLSVGNLVGIAGIGGLTSANGFIWVISATTANTFTLQASTGNGAFSSNGTWYKVPNTRATAITLQNGIYVKSGDSTRRYLGSSMTIGTSGNTEDLAASRLVWNVNNRVMRRLYDNSLTGSGYTYSTATYRNLNFDATNSINVLTGVAEEMLWLQFSTFVESSSNDASAAVGIGVDSGTTNSAIQSAAALALATGLWNQCTYQAQPAIGWHGYFPEEVGATGTQTWFNVSNALIEGWCTS